MSDKSTPDTKDDVESSPSSPQFLALRVWPAVILALVMPASLIPAINSDGSLVPQAIIMLTPALCSLLILLWWMVASRARWKERLLGLGGIIVVVGLTLVLIDKSMRGVPTIMVTVPMGMAAFAIGAALFRNMLSFKRTAIIIAIAAAGFGFSLLLRGGGVWGASGLVILEWRFTESAEQRLLADRANRSSSSNPGLAGFATELTDQWLADPDWPGFRGADRSSNVTGVTPDSDWTTNPPEKLWSISVGPGWSSFSIAGKLLFTQEQRGEMETVVCYSAESGEELWTQGIESRFEDQIGGPGPRATPTIALGDLFVLGASGQLMRLDAKTGDILWKSDLCNVAGRKPPTWGFSSSPLVTESVVVVHAGGEDELGTLAFNVNTGDLVWSVAAGDHSYSSPQLCSVGDQSFIAMVSNDGFDLIDPDTGVVKLAYSWKEQGYRALQPHVVGQDSILVSGMGGSRLIQLAVNDNKLTAKESWTSRFMKPDFNDLVVFKDHAYGFNGTIFACIDLGNGERAWKGGRYGKGQVLLFGDAGLLLVLSERGELVLLQATPSGHEELGRIDGIDGKTWNHPVVVGDRLYIRNSSEAACFRLPVRETTTGD